MNASLIDTLAMGNFTDAISDPEMRLKIQQRRPKVFSETVKVAVELKLSISGKAISIFEDQCGYRIFFGDICNPEEVR